MTTARADYIVLHRDEDLIALDKPTGLLSVPGIGPEKQDCLATRVDRDFPGARIVHRLDRDTSGVIVMAFGADNHRALSIQFQDRKVEKTYVAVVLGAMDVDEGEVDLPIRKDLDNPPCQIVDFEHGRPSLTRFRVVSVEADRSRVMLFPVTGRSHQLRVHLREIGHPVLGDDLYAPPEGLAMADRLMLHAETLAIEHPRTGEVLSFRSPAPF